MSKKKNTLQDLDDFLKQQAASLVQPTTLREKVEAQEVHKTPSIASPVETPELISTETILQNIKTFSRQEGSAFRSKFYDLIIQSVESQSASQPEDKMLINTALYLKSGSQWQDRIRAYWKNKNL